MNILIIDDSVTARLFLTDTIEKHGHKVYQAKDGKSGVDMIGKLNLDLIMLDLLMPELDGFEVLRILKRNKAEVPVFVLSADIQDDVRDECLDLGAKQFITKPFTADDIISAINNLK